MASKRMVRKPTPRDGFTVFMSVLSRLRQQEPIPVTSEQLLAELLPAWWLALPGAPGGRRESNVIRLANLRVPPGSTYLYVAPTGANSSAWFWFESFVPLSADGGDLPLVLGRVGPVATAVWDWHKRARKIADQIEEAVGVIEPLFRSNVHPTVAYKEWPQLQSIAPLPMQNARRCLREGEALNMLRGIPQARREEIAELYARALMLPDAKLTAWVGEYIEGD